MLIGYLQNYMHVSYTVNMKTRRESGYVGLIILLISVAAIALIFAFTVLAPENDSGNPEQIGRTDIDKAQETIEIGKEAEKTMQSYEDDIHEEIEHMM